MQLRGIKLNRAFLAKTGTYFVLIGVNSAVALLAVLLLAKFLPPAEYGRVGLFLSFVYFASPLISVSADTQLGVMRATMPANEFDRYRRSYIALAYVIFVIAELLLVAARSSGAFQDPLLFCAPVLGLTRFLVQLKSTEYIVTGRQLQDAIITIVSTLASLGIAIVGCFIIGGRAETRVIALIAADILAIFIRYAGDYSALGQLEVRRETSRRIFAFGSPLLLALLAAWILNEGGRLVIARERGLAETGLYTVAASLGTVATVINQALINVATPRVYADLRSEEGKDQILVRYGLIFLAVASAFMAVIATLYSSLGDSLLPAKYRGIGPLIYAFLLLGVCRSMYGPYSIACDYLQMTMRKSVAVWVAAAVSIAICLTAVPRLGSSGAILGCAAGYLTLAALLHCGIRTKFAANR